MSQGYDALSDVTSSFIYFPPFIYFTPSFSASSDLFAVSENINVNFSPNVRKRNFAQAGEKTCQRVSCSAPDNIVEEARAVRSCAGDHLSSADNDGLG